MYLPHVLSGDMELAEFRKNRDRDSPATRTTVVNLTYITGIQLYNPVS